MRQHGYAAVINFDAAAEKRLKDLWETLEQAGVESSLLPMGARPHLSLAVFEEIDEKRLCAELKRFAETFTDLTVNLHSVGAFPGEHGVVYLTPGVTPELLALHAGFHTVLDRMGIPSVREYRPGDWVPHCTVAMDLPLDQVSIAVDVTRSSEVFGPARLCSLALVAFLPLRELCVHPLCER